MTPEVNKELIRQYFDALRRDKHPVTLDMFIAEEEVELKQHIAMYEVSFPGYWLEALDMIAEGDKVFVRAVFHGVHAGQLMDIAPTGKSVAAPLFIAYQIAHGKIVAHWMLADLFGIMRQIGAVPAPSLHDTA
jgi:predicted ester cyclase